MLRKIILSSLVLGILSTPSTEAYATELLANENPTVIYESSNAKRMYGKATVKSFDMEKGMVVEYKDENGNVEQEVAIDYLEGVEIYDMVTGEQVDGEAVHVGDEILVHYLVFDTGEVDAIDIFVNIDDPNVADSIVVLTESTDLNEATEKTFVSYYSQDKIKFDETVQLYDVSGNQVGLDELHNGDVVLCWYDDNSINSNGEIVPEKAILMQNNVKEVSGTTTVQLKYENFYDDDRNELVDVASFYASDGVTYIFPNDLDMVDTEGNEVEVEDLKEGDIVTIDYTGTAEEYENRLYNIDTTVTSATLDTTDHAVTGTITMELQRSAGSGGSTDENGDSVQNYKSYLSDDGFYEVKIDDSSTITDINGNDIGVDDLKTGDVVTIDYTALQLGEQLINMEATNTVVKETTPLETGTVTVELGEVTDESMIVDKDSNMVHEGITFKSKDEMYEIVFYSKTEIVDAEGNEVETVDLQTGDVVTIDYTGRELDGQMYVTATSAVVEDQVKEKVSGTATIRLGSPAGGAIYDDVTTMQKFESDDMTYRVEFNSDIPIIDSDGNEVSLEELERNDIVTFDYVGTELDGRFNVTATSAILDTTDRTVTGTTTLQLGEIYSDDAYEDKDGNTIQHSVTFVAEDEQYDYLIQFKNSSEIMDINGNEIDIRDLETGDTVTVDYTGEELNGQVKATATTTVVQQ